MKRQTVHCGMAHGGNKRLVWLGNGFAECIGCGKCYMAAQVDDAKQGDFAGRGLPYIPTTVALPVQAPGERPARYVNHIIEPDGFVGVLSWPVRVF